MFFVLQESFNSSESCPEHESDTSDFSADSASDYNFSRLLCMAQKMQEWIKVMHPRINEMRAWQRDIGPLLTEIVAHQRDSSQALKDIISELQLLRSQREASELALEAMQSVTRSSDGPDV